MLDTLPKNAHILTQWPALDPQLMSLAKLKKENIYINFTAKDSFITDRAKGAVALLCFFVICD